MSTAVARQSRAIARPLKVLIPLIRADIELGDRAGMEHYADAGDKLLEAKSQVAHGYWGAWLSKNFDRRPETARLYMRYAEMRADRQNGVGNPVLPHSLNNMRGYDVQARARRAAEQPFRAVLADLDTNLYAQEKQTREDELRLHREIALELVDIGWKALATKLHPDRGGSKDAMRRLNRVREQLKGVAENRRFI